MPLEVYYLGRLYLKQGGSMSRATTNASSQGKSHLVGGWMLFVNCGGVDPDLFFPERGASQKEAKAVCRSCVVREDCLEYALENDEKFGIWGGLSERERRRYRRQLARAKAARNKHPTVTS